MKDKNKKKQEETEQAPDVNMEELQEQLEAAQQLAREYLKLQDELEQVKKKSGEYLEIAQRGQAEFDNFRKRNASLRTDSISEGRCEILTALLPVMDNFDRALDAIKEDDPSREGVELIYRQLESVLGGFSCKASVPLGEPFDPNLHNAVVQSPAQEGETPGSIVEVIQKGYTMDDKILRYPMVRVAAE